MFNTFTFIIYIYNIFVNCSSCPVNSEIYLRYVSKVTQSFLPSIFHFLAPSFWRHAHQHHIAVQHRYFCAVSRSLIHKTVRTIDRSLEIGAFNRAANTRPLHLSNALLRDSLISHDSSYRDEMRIQPSAERPFMTKLRTN